MSQFVTVLSAVPRISHHLRTLLPNVTVVDVDGRTGGKNAESVLNESTVLVADCDLLIPYIDKLPSAKWIQLTWAGVNTLMPHLQGKNTNFKISRFSDKSFGAAMSEYVIAQIVNHERDQRRQYENQRNKIWSKNGKLSDHRFISDLSVGVLGVGNIGKSIARTLKHFEAKVWGMSRTKPVEKLSYLDEHRTSGNLPEILSNCDYVINVMPSTKETTGLLNGNVLQNCKDKNTVFINIGRGNIIREDDLVTALESNWISAAILDVFEEEPLPQTSKLWHMPQVTISPHNSGTTRAQDVAKFFAENYSKYLAGETIPNTLDYKKGY